MQPGDPRALVAAPLCRGGRALSAGGITLFIECLLYVRHGVCASICTFSLLHCQAMKYGLCFGHMDSVSSEAQRGEAKGHPACRLGSCPKARTSSLGLGPGHLPAYDVTAPLMPLWQGGCTAGAQEAEGPCASHLVLPPTAEASHGHSPWSRITLSDGTLLSPVERNSHRHKWPHPFADKGHLCSPMVEPRLLSEGHMVHLGEGIVRVTHSRGVGPDCQHPTQGAQLGMVVVVV